MQKFKLALSIILIGTASPVLGGCSMASLAEGVATPASIANNTTADEKAFIIVVAGMKTLERGAGVAVDLGLLKAGSPTAIKVADLLEVAKKAIDKGYNIRKGLTTGSLAEQTRIATDALAAVAKLTGQD